MKKNIYPKRHYVIIEQAIKSYDRDLLESPFAEGLFKVINFIVDNNLKTPLIGTCRTEDTWVIEEVCVWWNDRPDFTIDFGAMNDDYKWSYYIRLYDKEYLKDDVDLDNPFPPEVLEHLKSL